MKISPYIYVVIGLALGLVVLSFGLFHFYLPNMKAAAYQKELGDQRQAIVDDLPRAEKRVEDAKRAVDEEAVKWRQIVVAHTPPRGVGAGGIDLAVNPWQLAIDSRKFRNNVQRAVNGQLLRGGVKVINGPLVPFPEENSTALLANYYNFPAIPFPVVIFDLGTVTVQGTYSQIMANVRAWRSMRNYLAVADGLSLQGTSPQLTGTYNLTIVGYIRGEKLFGDVNESGTATTGGTAGGFGPPAGGMMGGPPSGMMGGPPSGMGSRTGPPSGMGSAPPGAGGPPAGATMGGGKPPAPAAAAPR